VLRLSRNWQCLLHSYYQHVSRPVGTIRQTQIYHRVVSIQPTALQSDWIPLLALSGCRQCCGAGTASGCFGLDCSSGLLLQQIRLAQSDCQIAVIVAVIVVKVNGDLITGGQLHG